MTIQRGVTYAIDAPRRVLYGDQAERPEEKEEIRIFIESVGVGEEAGMAGGYSFVDGKLRIFMVAVDRLRAL